LQAVEGRIDSGHFAQKSSRAPQRTQAAHPASTSPSKQRANHYWGAM
jgi:hypothetical protein